MFRNFVTFYDIQRMYLEIRTNELKFLDYEFPYYSIENDVVIKKSVHIKDIVVTNGFITTKNSVHTTNNLIEFLSSLSHYLVLQDDSEFYYFYFFRKDLEDFLCCIFCKPVAEHSVYSGSRRRYYSSKKTHSSDRRCN